MEKEKLSRKGFLMAKATFVVNKLITNQQVVRECKIQKIRYYIKGLMTRKFVKIPILRQPVKVCPSPQSGRYPSPPERHVGLANGTSPKDMVWRVEGFANETIRTGQRLFQFHSSFCPPLLEAIL